MRIRGFALAALLAGPAGAVEPGSDVAVPEAPAAAEQTGRVCSSCDNRHKALQRLQAARLPAGDPSDEALPAQPATDEKGDDNE